MRKMVQWVKTNDPKFDQLCQERERLVAELEQTRKSQAELEAELERLDELA
jgi:cell division protein FtsB